MKKCFDKWTGVKTSVSDSCAEFEVWGRKYRFENSFLPTSIISLGAELLEAPVKMTALFGRKPGQWHDFHYLLIEKSDEKAVVVISAECENVLANATVTVEFDGFVKIDLRICSEWQFARDGRSKAEMDGLYMDIPLKSDVAKLFHYWPNDRQSIIPAPNVMNSGEMEDIELPFKPYIWSGNEQVGLGFFAGESEKNFRCGDDCIKITGSNMRINFLNAMHRNWWNRSDLWVDTLKPITYTFGFHATPVKQFEYDEYNYKRFHLYYVRNHDIYNTDVAERAAAAGVKWLILHEDWTVIQNYGLAEDEEKFRAFVKKCHALGMKVMLYFGYEYSTMMPDFNEKCNENLIKNIKGNFTGGWQRKPSQRAYMACYRGGYSPVFLERVKYVMDNYGADGIYTDGTYVPWECANEEHGCGYRDEQGALHPSYPILPVREHVKKLYEIVHERGGVVDTHQSSCSIMPTLSFCDSYYDGENIQGQLTNESLEFLNLAAFRAEYMGINYGIPANFISLTSEDRTIETLESLTLLHNVHTRANTFENLEYSSKIWKIFDKLGLEKAPWHPYWDNPHSEIAEDGAYTSSYDTENGTVIYAVDFKGGRTVSLKVNGASVLVDADGNRCEKTDGVFKIDLGKNKPNYFTVE